MLQFLYSPDLISDLTEKPRVRVAQFGDGYSQRAGDAINTILQKWALKFTAAVKADADQMFAFFRAHAGVTAFQFIVPASDYSVTGENFGTGDGSSTEFQLHRQVLTQAGASALSGSYEDSTYLTTTPTIYVAGVAKVEGTDYTRSSTGLITFTVAPANGAALTWDGSGQVAKNCICTDWGAHAVALDVYDVTATFEEVAES